MTFNGRGSWLVTAGVLGEWLFGRRVAGCRTPCSKQRFNDALGFVDISL